MGDAPIATMHAAFFGLKRAHQSTVRIGRPMLAKMGLTAARFDLLYALMQRRHGMFQTRLQKKLGVGRATVSRMLGSLEKLGLVERKTDDIDRRRKLVALTASGRERIGAAHKHLTRSGWAQLALDSALGAEGRQNPWYRGSCILAMTQLEDLLGAVRRGFYDTGDLEYPWDPPESYAEDRPRRTVPAWEDGEGVV
jgi:DNA-binding MarR family transcriptional regulator